MLTTFEQFEQWVRDNGFKHWCLYQTKTFQDGEEKYKSIVIDSNMYPADMNIDDKLNLTKRHLQTFDQKLYACGWQKENQVGNPIVCEVYMREVGTNGIQVAPPLAQQVQDIGQIREELRKSIAAEMEAKWEKKEFEREKKQFEDDRKAFKEMEAGVWGMIVNKVGPMILSAQQLRNVAGADTKRPIITDPINPIEKDEPDADPDTQEPETHEPETHEPSPWDAFTEEEGTELITLMAEFKELEPNYMQMLRKVVEMAKSGDKTYAIAKNFLL